MKKIIVFSGLDCSGKSTQIEFLNEIFSKKGKNFFKTANKFTEKTLNMKVDSQSKIYCNQRDIEEAKKKYNITPNTKKFIIAPAS